VRIVKPAEWTQHDPYTSFSLYGPVNPGPISLLHDHYIPFHTVFKHFYQEIYRILAYLTATMKFLYSLWYAFTG
jgi:hypothetical protein